MPDFTPVPTVELLTRAADAAGQAAGTISRLETQSGVTWADGVDRLGGMSGPRKSLAFASGPDHWRTVEAMFGGMVGMHWREAEGLCDMCIEPFPCPTLRALRPLAEQVLRDLGDTA